MRIEKKFSRRFWSAAGSMVDDVVLNKGAVVERCFARIREEHAGDDKRLFENRTKQDSTFPICNGRLAFYRLA
jgi:hypothetical protein